MRPIPPGIGGGWRGLLSAFLALALFSPALFAQQFQIADIRVEGLRRISPGTVFNYLPVQIGDTVGDDVTGNIIRTLYQTGFFDDVEVEREGNVLVLQVQERPAIAKIEFTGNKDLDEKALRESVAEIGLKEGRVFNRRTLDRIEQELERQYFSRGKYGVLVQSTVSPLERNRVAVRIDITEGLTARIKQINIIGNKAFKEKKLLKRFKLGPTRWHSFYSKNDRYSKQQLAGDLEELRSFYLDRGYIKFEIVSTQVSISADRKEIYVTVSIDEGAPYRISDIRLAGEPEVAVEKIFPMIELRRGEYFSRKETTASADRISSLLGDEGYAFANVNTIPELDEEAKEVAVTFFVDPGKRVYVRRVNMKGNTRTRDEVLRREMRQLETAWFSAAKVRESKERLSRLGFFDDVTMETPAVAGSADQVDVDVTVQEKPSGNLLAGVGYSQSQGVLFNASVTQTNFLGTGKRVSFALNTSSVTRQLQLAYQNPYYTIDGISRGFELAYRATDYDELIGSDYTTDVAIAGVNIGLPITENSRATASLRYQYTDFTAGVYSAIAQLFEQVNGSIYNDLVLGLSYGYDSRDTAVFTSRGGLHSLSAEVTVPGSDLTYYKLRYRGAQYIPLTRKLVFAVSADLGYGGGYGDLESLPFFLNYYAGGPRSVRGYESNRLGPRDVVYNDPVGGNALISGSVELFAPPPIGNLDKTVRLGAFFDFGNVWWTEQTSLVAPTGFDLGELRYSAGLSVDWLSPIGALSLSLAYPLNEKEGDQTQVFQFGIGQTF